MVLIFVKCRTCEEVLIDKSTLLRHKPKDPNISCCFKCRECGKIFSKPSDYYYDSKKHSSKRKKKHNSKRKGQIMNCEVCLRSFSKETSLEKHKKKYHEVSKNNEVKSNKVLVLKNPSDDGANIKISDHSDQLINTNLTSKLNSDQVAITTKKVTPEIISSTFGERKNKNKNKNKIIENEKRKIRCGCHMNKNPQISKYEYHKKSYEVNEEVSEVIKDYSEIEEYSEIILFPCADCLNIYKFREDLLKHKPNCQNGK